MLKTHTEEFVEALQLTDICIEYGYEFKRTSLNGTHYVSTNLNTLNQNEVVTPLRFVEILVRDAHSAAKVSEQRHAAGYKEGLKETLLERIDDLERTLRYGNPTMKETKTQLEAKLAIIQTVMQI